MDDKTRAVQAMQDYIDAHLSEAVSPADLAAAACYSPWYAAKLFKELTGLPPAVYIRRLRLSRSALMLRDQRVKVAELAFSMGFNSVDGYQRAFRNAFGCNPKAYAKNPEPLPLFTVYGVKFSAVERKEDSRMANIQNVFIQIVDKPAHKVVVKRGVCAEDYMAYCREVGCDVWGILTSMKSLCGEPVCLWLPEKYRPIGSSVYVQGVELPLDYAGPVPAGFDTIEFPVQKYLMFQGEPFDEEDYCAAIDALQQAIDRYDPAVIGFAWDDESPRIQLEPIGARGYIELKAVKPLKS